MYRITYKTEQGLLGDKTYQGSLAQCLTQFEQEFGGRYECREIVALCPRQVVYRVQPKAHRVTAA